MFVDTSALVAMLTNEDDAADFAQRLSQTAKRLSSPIAQFETVAAVARINALPLDEAGQAVESFLQLLNIQVLALPPKASILALEAFERFGRGNDHPAQLNMGECYSYACARYFRVPLLFKGNGFVQTDIERA
ncbi:type II toxin-antitoxin system VapC family toxin [Beijerinckia mobilis]|uniref:type II toxin-antitoxin system VapC family toxin n=1 Tax=Beijerinckia mobilis TaxID=231434 RepID=UPI00054E865E|nr:type II toxin-antitoxin system VapC family toxin [Beijerinckia mobilis]